MRPLSRILAICQGGALDGLRFSVVANDDNTPPVMLTGAPEEPVVYTPWQELELSLKLEEALEVQRRLNDGADGVSEADKPLPFTDFELYLDEYEEAGIVRGHNFIGVWKYQLTT